MSGQKGIIESTMLLRRIPFGEWVVVYYEPDEINEDEIVAKIRGGGCPNSSVIRSKNNNLVMNPIVAPGDPIQLQIEVEEDGSLEIVKLPKKWKMISEIEDLKAGTHFLTVEVPSNAKRAQYKIHLRNGPNQVLGQLIPPED